MREGSSSEKQVAHTQRIAHGSSRPIKKVAMNQADAPT